MCKTGEEIRITTIFKSFGIKKIIALAVTSNTLKYNFV
jgi:hypothetical protein